MAWIESHEDIGDHKKTGFLSQHLKCDVPTAVGYVHLLWHYTLKVAWKDGDLSDFIPPLIERACWWRGAAGALVKAFQDSGYMDAMKVHDWKEYAKHIIYQREYNKKRRQESTPFPQSHNRKSTDVRTAATLPDLTRPNHKKRAQSFIKPTAQEVAAYGTSIGFKIDGPHFLDHYEARGWQYKNGQPMKDWKAAVRTWKSNDLKFASQGKETVASMPGIRLKPGQDPWRDEFEKSEKESI